jgi:hypothetical protein
MERLNELENEIVMEYVNRIIGSIDHNLIQFNGGINITNLPVGISDIIIKYLVNSPNENKKIILARGLEGKMIEKELYELCKDNAIREFLFRLDNQKRPT